MEKERTPEQIENARKVNVKNTLESKLIKDSIGNTFIRNNEYLFGQLGLQSAKYVNDEVSRSDEFGKIRNDLYTKRKQELEKNGIPGEPSMPSNAESYGVLKKQVNEVQSVATLDELAEYVKQAGADLKIEIPQILKNKSYVEVIKKVYEKNAITEQGINKEKLSDEEKNVLELYKNLTEAYTLACAKKISDLGLYEEINQNMNKIAEKYKPTESKKAA